MLLFSLLLIPIISVAPTKTVGDYSITTEGNVLTNIQKIDSHKLSKTLNLSGHHLSGVKKEAFNNVMDIETLDLSGNDISILPSDIFSQLKNLKHLLLANNKLGKIRKSFEGLEHLESLDISNNSIINLNKGQFCGIPKSADIKTTGNKFRTISRGLFAEVNANKFAILCQHQGIVKSLKVWKGSERLQRDCRRVRVDVAHWKWITVFLNQSSISGFDQGWYRLHNMEIDGLDLTGNNIVDITSDFFNGLPRRLKYINLSKNKIEQVKKGIIVLKNLAWLNLEENLINEIENDAFKDTRLQRIILNNNRLSNINFVATLPVDHLLHLKLRNNRISELAADSFSRLFQLNTLDLAWNEIIQVKGEHLRGLWNLYSLDLQGNGLNQIYPDCFQSVATLEHLNLSNNHLSNLDSGIFKNLRHMETLDLSHTDISTLPPYVFSHLKHLKNLYLGSNALKEFHLAFVGLSNLHLLDISYNPITSVNEGDFSGLPKGLNILSDGNAISSTNIKRLYEHSIVNVFEESPTIELCVSNGVVTSLRTSSKQDSTISNQCQVVEITSDEFHGKAIRQVSLQGMRISSFLKGWYGLQDVYITHLDLSGNAIIHMTGQILNDLPKSLTHVNLSGNRISRLKKGVIVNKYLTTLILTDNRIRVIEDNALENTNLFELSLRGNYLTNTRFAATLPPTLLRLYAPANNINEISAASFSRLNKLIHLNLNANQITNIEPECLRGLSSVEKLWLSSNHLRVIQGDSFQDLKALKRLHLGFNRLKSLDKRAFHGLANVLYISLKNNEFEKITKDSFPHLPDTLQSLNLMSNKIDSLETGSFDRVPKYELSLADNKITKLEEGVFNLPDLVVLRLEDNKLSELNGDSFKSMPNLEELYLGRNNIATIGKDAAKYLNKIYILDISQNAITKLNNGQLSGLANLPDQKFEAIIRLDQTPIEHISGGLFDDELEASA